MRTAGASLAASACVTMPVPAAVSKSVTLCHAGKPLCQILGIGRKKQRAHVLVVELRNGTGEGRVILRHG